MILLIGFLMWLLAYFSIDFALNSRIMTHIFVLWLLISVFTMLVGIPKLFM